MKTIVKNPYILLFFGAVLLSLSFARDPFWPAAWFAFMPLMSVLRRMRSFVRAMWVGFIFGVMFYVLTIYWIMHVASAFGMLYVAAHCAVYYALFAGIVWVILYRRKRSFIVELLNAACVVPLVWVTLEVVRTEMPVIGFGWALVGYSQTTNRTVLQVASVVGVYGLSALVMFFNATVMTIIGYTDEKRLMFKRKLAAFAGVVLILGLCVGYGVHALKQHRPDGPIVKIGVVQPNIPQHLKWDPEVKDLIVRKVAALTELTLFDQPDLVVLPEAAYPGDLAQEFEQSPFKRIADESDVPLIIGAPYLNEWRDCYNSAFYIADGAIQKTHHKMVLVPFGEFIPCKPLFALIGLDKVAYSLGVGDFKRGEEYTLFPVERFPYHAGVLVCFEDTMPQIARAFVRAGADMLINITNDAWFMDTRAPFQHMQASVMRAVEDGVYVVRAANTGVSAFIAPNGDVLNAVMDKDGKKVFVTGGVVQPIPFYTRDTLYRHIGGIVPIVSGLCAIIGVLINIFPYKSRRSSR